MKKVEQRTALRSLSLASVLSHSLNSGFGFAYAHPNPYGLHIPAKR